MINFLKKSITIISVILFLVTLVVIILELSRLNGVLSELYLRSITVLTEQSFQKLVLFGFVSGVSASWMIQNIVNLVFSKKSKKDSSAEKVEIKEEGKESINTQL